ncbi:SurA N-terminal domain-containing protein [Brevibacillus composti]|uniref:SurA N-terminal domain-containing protein n=1 Tax=Brevibacillus composti TaxID=2796470 RepID=A0A7T5EJV9_9BACL|nr:SurA N-terminal domain-containing protein [Brevibacillus composti]QQE73928.1 SurA N-terminal domain-containing protein [Brevibacillus composti]QUO41012.1 SurA N-terminal domain-containing protein [Brevibacillus composti]
MKKFDLSMLSIAILLLALVILGVALKPADDPVLVTSSRGDITQSELYEQMKESYGKKTLGVIVSRNMVVEEAKDQGVSIDESEVDQEMNRLIEQLGSRENFEQTLKNQGYTEEGFRGTVRTLLLRDKLFEKVYPVSEQDIQAFYEKNKDKFGNPAPDLEQVRPEIVKQLNKENRKKHMDDWLIGLEKKFNVKFLDPSLAPDDVLQNAEASQK